MKSIIIQLRKISKLFAKRHHDIADIIIFGSIIRGKELYNDIDIILLFKNNINKDLEYELKKQFLKISKKITIISKTKKEYKKSSFDAREGILFEGQSLINSRYIAQDFGFKSFGLFIYHTKGISNVKKTRFYYALNGRGKSKGVVDILDGIKISDNNIIFPLEKIEKAKNFFDYWQFEYKYIPILIPQRLGRGNILSKVR